MTVFGFSRRAESPIVDVDVMQRIVVYAIDDTSDVEARIRICASDVLQVTIDDCACAIPQAQSRSQNPNALVRVVMD